MRLHYHIWLIGAACALVVLATGSFFSLLEARELNRADAARTTPTTAPVVPMLRGELPATATEPSAHMAAPAAKEALAIPSYVPDAPRVQHLSYTSGPQGKALPAATPTAVP